MKKLQTLFLALLSCLLLVGFNLGVYADTPAKPEESPKQYQVQVIDRAKLLTPEQRQLLVKDMEPLTTHGNMVFYTTTLKKGANFEKNAEHVYYQLYKNEPGVIFQIDMGNRKLTLSASTGMEDLIGSERDSILSNIYEKATYKDYYGCAKACFDQIQRIINNEAIAHDMKYIDNGICALIIGLLLNFIYMFNTVRKKASKKKLLGEIVLGASLANIMINAGKVTKRYEPKSKGSSGGGGGFHGGGGGGGGGFSGGSSSHGF